MGQVIDLMARLLKAGTSIPVVENQAAEVVDISSARALQISEDRREVRRTVLTEFISLHAVIPGYGLLRVTLFDINDRGLSFDLEEAKGKYNVTDQIELRIYLNHQTYFPITTQVAYIKKIEDEGVYRHGCEFAKDSINNQALKYFVGFLESVTTHFRKDSGDLTITRINS